MTKSENFVLVRRFTEIESFVIPENKDKNLSFLQFHRWNYRPFY